jgi:phenylalanyl-tRNA synthetase beta chain
MQRALMDAGMRPINNIVDVTNYVMLELGQPLHAYDLEKLSGRKLIARRAGKDEKVVTIDQVERNLSENMLVIADSENPACIAGVMGGFNTEISDDTKVMVLESANFNPKSVRETAKKIGLRSEASARNEKPMHYKMAEFASQRACQLIESIGAGTIVEGYMEAGKSEYIPPVVTLRPYRSAELLGVEIPVADMLKSLNTLEINSTYDGEKINSEIPFFRADIVEEADLIEEVGRMYGLENIISEPLKGKIKKGKKSAKREVEDEIKDIAAGMGLCELTTYSFISPKSYDNICASEDSELRKYIKILNPLGEDYSSMRTTLMSNMMDVIQRNSFRGVEEAKLFEVGNVFVPLQLPVTEPPLEKSKLCIGFYGKYDFYDMKGIVEAILSRFGISVSLVPVNDVATFHAGRTAGMYINNEYIGMYGEVSSKVLSNYGLNHSVYLAEIDVEKILEYKNKDWKYEPLPKYPAMVRDIAVKVKDEVLVGDMEDTIKAINPHIIESVKLFDVYRGEHIEKGYKSTAFSVTYRNKERTLKEKEVESIHKKILEALEIKYGATLR